MSSGRTHASVAKVLLIPAAIGASISVSLGYVEEGVGIFVGAFAGLIITPDADIDKMSWERRRWFNIWTPLGHIWYLLWYAYGKMFKHRGISHFPLIGTATRILYVTIIAICCQLLFEGSPDVASQLWPLKLIDSYPMFSAFTFVSWSIQDIVHSLFDVVSTFLKRRRLLWYAKDNDSKIT